MNHKLLFISHSLDNSGAPVVLVDCIKFCISYGCHVDLVSLDDGDLHSSLEKMNISVTIADDFLEGLNKWKRIFSHYDAVIVNTLVCIEAIYSLSTTSVPTIWWIHEHEPCFIHYKPIFPKPEDLPQNIHVYGVSPITCDLIRKYCGYDTDILPFGIEDNLPFLSSDTEKNSSNVVNFVVPGKFSFVKGQDILINSISLLPDDYKSICHFSMFGAELDEEKDFFNNICSNIQNSDFISVSSSVDHIESLKQIYKSDFLIVPSRFEPFSATAVEAMMLKSVPITSNICGVNYFISKYTTDFIFESESPTALCKRIISAIDTCLNNPQKFGQYQELFRKCYEDNFSVDTFMNKFMSLINTFI